MLATIFLMISSKASADMSLPYYVCSSYSDTQTTDYYGYGRDHSFHFPIQWSLVDQVGHCTDECWPCESYHLRHREMMIGYGGTCTISSENQIALGLYNVTTEHRGREKSMATRSIRLHDTVNPFELSGVFESRSPHFFIKKYSLCIYPIQRFTTSVEDTNRENEDEPVENMKEFDTSAMAPTRPAESTITPTRQVESTITPTRPVEDTRQVESTRPIDTTRPVESTITPTRPVESTITPTRPVEFTMVPIRPVEFTMVPIRPVESTITRARPVESTITPTQPIEATRPVESTKTPTRPVEATRPVESTKTPIQPIEATRPVEETLSVESTKTPTRPVEETRSVESTKTPTRPVEFTMAHIRSVESTNTPTRSVESTKAPTRPFEPVLSQSDPIAPQFSSETLTLILVSLLGILTIVIVLLIILIFCKKEKVASNLPSDIQHYIDKHNDMLVLRFDQDCPEKVVYPKEINTPKYIEYKDLESHIAVSWSTLHHLYTAVKTNWKSVINDIGMKKYIEKDGSRPLIIYKAFRIADEIMTPDKTYVLTKVVLSNEQPDLMVFVVEEKLVYFRQKFIFVVHKDRLNHISVKTNLPEYHIFQNFSYKTFEAFTEHSIHDKILIASRHKKEYDKIDLSEVENGVCDLRRVATLTTQNKKSLEYVKEIDAIKHGLENTTFKLSY